MDECLLYNEPDLYDLLFPNAEASARVHPAGTAGVREAKVQKSR